MITSLHLRNFKRFESLDVTGFSKVNLISGKNNCGKTGLLEAIMLACAQLFATAHNMQAWLPAHAVALAT